MTESDWWAWYWGLVALSASSLVVLAPGTIGDYHVVAWFIAPLDREGMSMARSGRSAPLAIGALHTFRRECAQWGMQPLAPQA